MAIGRDGDSDACDGAAAAARGVAAGRPADPRARTSPGIAASGSMRRVPHRSARCGRRSASSETAADPRPRNHRPCHRLRRRRFPLPSRRPRRCPVARLDLRRCANTAAAGARICARAPASPATRSTAAMPNTPSPTQRYCFPIDPHFRDAEAAPLMCAGLIGYRTLRMAGDARAHRHLRLRRRRAHRRAGGAPRGATDLRLHAAGRHGGAAVRTQHGRRMGRRIRPTPAGSARCRADLRPGRRPRARGAARDRARAAPSFAVAST